MKVSEMFLEEKIDSDFIERKFEGGYWESANKFIEESWGRDFDSLSSKQQYWLKRILDDCVEKRIEGSNV